MKPIHDRRARTQGTGGRLALVAALLLVSACDDGTGPGPARRNPLEGATLHVPYPTPASEQVEAWRDTRPEDAAAIERIASEPRAVWLSTADPGPTLSATLADAAASSTVPVFALYYIPYRDCTDAGAATAAEYRAWVREVAAAIDAATVPAVVVVLEPDALAALGCLGPAEAAERLDLLRDAVLVLEPTGALVYIDAGHPRWLPAREAAQRLESVGVERAEGFALNVANFVGTDENVAYGRDVASRLGDVGFVIDTGRNGAGPAPGNEWCNPPGRKLGHPPTTRPGIPGVDALLWVKPPGESDGLCNGGPPAGEWWPEYALGLAS